MKHASLALLLSIGAAAMVFEVGANAQNATITDSHAWLQRYEQQQGSPSTPEIDPAQQAVYDHIAAVQNASAQMVASSHNGGWQSDSGGSGRQLFSVQLQRNKSSGALSGRAIVTGSNLLTAGNVTGQITGSSVSGAVTDATGFQLVTFTGSVSTTGMSGKYQTSDGDSGTWAYQDAGEDPSTGVQ